tara:strand:+ start:288 stop:479 length:192 start_codon:yes stop_codon:yes gene_type:complete
MPELKRWHEHIWTAYNKIMQGLERLTLRDIQAYTELYDEPFEQWEVDALMGLDKARLDEWQTK